MELGVGASAENPLCQRVRRGLWGASSSAAIYGLAQVVSEILSGGACRDFDNKLRALRLSCNDQQNVGSESLATGPFYGLLHSASLVTPVSPAT